MFSDKSLIVDFFPLFATVSAFNTFFFLVCFTKKKWNKNGRWSGLTLFPVYFDSYIPVARAWRPVGNHLAATSCRGKAYYLDIAGNRYEIAR